MGHTLKSDRCSSWKPAVLIICLILLILLIWLEYVWQYYHAKPYMIFITYLVPTFQQGGCMSWVNKPRFIATTCCKIKKHENSCAESNITLHGLVYISATRWASCGTSSGGYSLGLVCCLALLYCIFWPYLLLLHLLKEAIEFYTFMPVI